MDELTPTPLPCFAFPRLHCFANVLLGRLWIMPLKTGVTVFAAASTLPVNTRYWERSFHGWQKLLVSRAELVLSFDFEPCKLLKGVWGLDKPSAQKPQCFSLGGRVGQWAGP